MATLEELTGRIRAAVAGGLDLERSVKLDLKGQGFIHIEGGVVTNRDDAADLVVTVAPRDLEAIARRELDPVRAIMTGRLRLSDMGLAMSLQSKIQTLFSGAG